MAAMADSNALGSSFASLPSSTSSPLCRVNSLLAKVKCSRAAPISKNRFSTSSIDFDNAPCLWSRFSNAKRSSPRRPKPEPRLNASRSRLSALWINRLIRARLPGCGSSGRRFGSPPNTAPAQQEKNKLHVLCAWCGAASSRTPRRPSCGTSTFFFQRLAPANHRRL